MIRGLGLVVLAGLLALGCGAAPAPSSAAGASTAARPPDFELPRLGGGSERLSDHFGKDVVLIDFWATFCKPCLRAMPDLDALYRARKDRGFVVLGVSIDGPGSTADVQAEVSRLAVTFPILLDQDSRAVTLYNPRASAPFSVLIGRDGRVLAQREGYTGGAHESIEHDIDRALGF
ncbi:MAG TPA: TlpA disulfide reductase family protein [Polyangiaceae bacterium]|nr:TlpA disulfide reductase family protein [Polyangiaceae bacterium]